MTSLRIAQQIPDTEAEGPGQRYAIWVQGCSLRCPGCCNPEMFTDSGGTLVDPRALADTIGATTGIEGISVLGGEPFEQAAAVAELCAAVQAQGRSVMVYSGYTLEELRARADPATTRLLQHIDVLCDGRYVREAPETTRRWLGSTNQRLHFLTDKGRADEQRFNEGNTVELRLTKDGLTVNGWPQSADAIRWVRR